MQMWVGFGGLNTEPTVSLHKHHSTWSFCTFHVDFKIEELFSNLDKYAQQYTIAHNNHQNCE